MNLRHQMRQRLLVLVQLTFLAASANAQAPRVGFSETGGEVTINIDDQSVASYVYDDKDILRPYFAHVRTVGGIQVTRNHPPLEDDRDDHSTMHPGIWLAFGDISGVDFWRNQGRVKHVKFIQKPSSERNMGSFIQLKRYVRPDDSTLCEEEFRFAIFANDNDYFLVLESIFSSEDEFYFGDQEEMGLGIRVATPISEVGGGKLTDSEGRVGAKNIWSNSAAWCDYSGSVDGQIVGMTLMCHPTNFGESWFHARDYGLVAANSFGRAAMKKGERSRVVVRPSEQLVLRYALWIHAKVDAESMQTAYNKYAKLGQER